MLCPKDTLARKIKVTGCDSGYTCIKKSTRDSCIICFSDIKRDKAIYKAKIKAIEARHKVKIKALKQKQAIELKSIREHEKAEREKLELQYKNIIEQQQKDKSMQFVYGVLCGAGGMIAISVVVYVLTK